MEIFGPLPEPQIRYAAHNHDMVAAAPAWDFYEIRFGAEPYKPESIDIAFGACRSSAPRDRDNPTWPCTGDNLWAGWRSLIFTGKIPNLREQNKTNLGDTLTVQSLNDVNLQSGAGVEYGHKTRLLERRAAAAARRISI